MFEYLVISFIGFGYVLSGNLHYGQYGEIEGLYTKSAVPYIGSGLVSHGGLTGGVYNQGHHYEPNGIFPAAVHSRRTYEVVRVPTYQEPPQHTRVDVDPVENPVSIRFVTKSSPVHIDQIHVPGEPGRYAETHSEDEPHRLLHTVTRPVIQEVREVIQPYRRVQQEIRPVVEEINTVVARGQHKEKAFVTELAPVVTLEAPVPAPHALPSPTVPTVFEAPVDAISGHVEAVQTPGHVLVNAPNGQTHPYHVLVDTPNGQTHPYHVLVDTPNGQTHPYHGLVDTPNGQTHPYHVLVDTPNGQTHPYHVNGGTPLSGPAFKGYSYQK